MNKTFTPRGDFSMQEFIESVESQNKEHLQREGKILLKGMFLGMCAARNSEYLSKADCALLVEGYNMIVKTANQLKVKTN